MKIIYIITILSFFSFASCNLSDSNDNKNNSVTDSTELEVRAVFDNYKNTILNDKGINVLKYVDSRTLKYYSEILEKVKFSDSASVNSNGTITKLMIFTIRHKVSKAEILSMNGKSLLVYAIDEGMVGKNGVSKVSIGEISIDGDFAKGEVLAQGEKTPLTFHFYFEENEWKIDLTSSFTAANIAIKEVIKQSGMNENEYLFFLLEMISGNPVSEGVWQPIQ